MAAGAKLNGLQLLSRRMLSAMKVPVRFTVAALCAGLTSSAFAAPAAADTAPLRHLVYNFQISNLTSQTVHTSGFEGGGDENANAPGDNSGGPAGVHDYRSGTSDQGTITVDVMQVQPDTGLVLRIAESGQNGRNSAPRMCVVYGTGSVICDESAGITTPEENSLLTLLGRGFVDKVQLDVHNHWHNATSGSNGEVTNDYTIAKTDGDIAEITYARSIKVAAAKPYTATTNGSLSYNTKLEVPLSVKEDTTSTGTPGMGGDYARTEQHLDLTLATDSMQAALNH
jgi:hypothetical protein